jgi:hypothetical protein
MRPSRGGFLRPFGCGWFIREFLLGNGPYGSPDIEPDTGAPQADIFYYYKNALRYVSAGDRAVKPKKRKQKKKSVLSIRVILKLSPTTAVIYLVNAGED